MYNARPHFPPSWSHLSWYLCGSTLPSVSHFLITFFVHIRFQSELSDLIDPSASILYLYPSEDKTAGMCAGMTTAWISFNTGIWSIRIILVLRRWKTGFQDKENTTTGATYWYAVWKTNVQHHNIKKDQKSSSHQKHLCYKMALKPYKIVAFN